MTAFENLSLPQRIRAAIHRDVRSISSETCHFLGLEITKSAMEVIAEMVYKKIALYGMDLEAFAKHAKRTTINADDVKLLVRRNPSLKSLLNKISPLTNPVAPKEKRRKTVTKTNETPNKNTENAENIDINAATTSTNIQELVSTREIVTKNTNQEKNKESTEKDDNLEDFIDNMILDTTIDLTFD